MQPAASAVGRPRPAPTSIAAATAARSPYRRREDGGSSSAALPDTSDRCSRIARISRARSPVDSYRSAAALARHRSMTQRSGGGTPGRSGRSAPDRMQDGREGVDPCPRERLAGQWPFRRGPNRMRTGPSGSPPGSPGPARGTCSPPCPRCRPGVGAHVAVVTPASRRRAASRLARPKSTIFTKPSRVTMTLAGFRSRCTIPASWAAARPSAICAPRSRSLRSGQRPGAISSPRAALDEFHGHPGDRSVSPTS